MSHVDVEAEVLEGLREISELEQEHEIYSQVSLDDTEFELPVDVVIKPSYVPQPSFVPLATDEVSNVGMIPNLRSPNAEFRCKVLVPAYFAGALIGKRGKVVHRLQQLTQTNMSMSGVDVFFPGTQDRMLTILAATKISFVCAVHAVVNEMLKAWVGTAQPNSHFVLKLVVPNSSVGKILGLGGVNLCQIQRITCCRISISRWNQGIHERVVVLMDSRADFLMRGAVAVLECIQDDPNLHEHMNFEYGVELPLGAWLCGKLGPAEPDAVLMPYETARRLPKRPILENLVKAAPKELLIRHGLLGSIKKILKTKTHEQVLAALGEALGGPPEHRRMSRRDAGSQGALPVGLQP